MTHTHLFPRRRCTCPDPARCDHTAYYVTEYILRTEYLIGGCCGVRSEWLRIGIDLDVARGFDSLLKTARLTFGSLDPFLIRSMIHIVRRRLALSLLCYPTDIRRVNLTTIL